MLRLAQLLCGLALSGLLAKSAVVRFRTDIGSGLGVTAISAIAVDSQGFIYLAGTTSWAQFPTTPGPFGRYVGNAGQTYVRGDVFVRKLEPRTFQVIYSVLVGGSRDGAATGIAVDSQGNAYVTGYTNSNDFPASTDLRDPRRNDDDAFVFKLNSSGTALVFSRVIGGSGIDHSNGIALGPDGSITIAGQTDSPDLPVTLNAVQSSHTPYQGLFAKTDAFVVRLSPDGATIQYGTYLGGPGDDLATDVAVDSAGDIYVAGFAGSYFPTLASSYSPNLVNGGFVSKISHTTGQLTYSTYVPGVSFTEDEPFRQLALRVDAEGNAYLAGPATTGFPATPGAFQSDLAGGPGDRDGFVLELDPQGRNLVFATLIGSLGDDHAVALTLQGTNILVAGVTQSTSFPTTDHSTPVCDLDVSPAYTFGEGYQPWGIFLTSFDHTGRLLNSAAYGDCSNQFTTGLALSATGSVYLTAGYSVAEATFLAEIDLAASAPAQISFMAEAAGFSGGPFAPLQLVSIFGKGLGPKTAVKAGLANGALPTSLAGTQVLVDGRAVPLLFVSDSQVNAILPHDAFLSPIFYRSIQVVAGSNRTQPFSTFFLNAAPGFFTSNGSGFGQLAALNEDGSINSPENPAPRGSIISLFGTGGGLTKPTFADGQVAPQAAPLIASGYAVVGLELAEITYQGAAPGAINGVAQINVRVPTTVNPGSRVPVRWAMPFGGFIFTQPGVTVAIK